MVRQRHVKAPVCAFLVVDGGKMMNQNKQFALVFRLCSLIFALAGVMAQTGVFRGTFRPAAAMYYTIQSNLFVIILFAVLTVRTAMSLRDGLRGSVGWHSRLGMVCAVDVLVTFIVFWLVMAPHAPTAYLLTFENIAVHAMTPMLCLLDYILFSERGRIKYRDVYYVCIFPAFYLIFTTLAGLAGYVYNFGATFGGDFVSESMDTAPVRFPYFFLDFDRLGIMVLAYVGGIFVFFILLSHVIYLLDRKVRKVS